MRRLVDGRDLLLLVAALLICEVAGAASPCEPTLPPNAKILYSSEPDERYFLRISESKSSPEKTVFWRCQVAAPNDCLPIGYKMRYGREQLLEALAWKQHLFEVNTMEQGVHALQSIKAASGLVLALTYGKAVGPVLEGARLGGLLTAFLSPKPGPGLTPEDQLDTEGRQLDAELEALELASSDSGGCVLLKTRGVSMLTLSRGLVGVLDHALAGRRVGVEDDEATLAKREQVGGLKYRAVLESEMREMPARNPYK